MTIYQWRLFYAILSTANVGVTFFPGWPGSTNSSWVWAARMLSLGMVALSCLIPPGR